MPLITNIAFRNLVRQKRRSLLLGIAIAFGAMVLILASAFSHGITKVLFERIVKYTNGHVSVSFMKNGNMMNQVFHDGDMMWDVVKKHSPEGARFDEAIGVFGRAIGNGVADNVILVGVDVSQNLTREELEEYEANFEMIHGSFEALNDKSKGTPVVLAEQKAKYLKLKIGDILKVRFTGVNNQMASAKLTVVGIFKPANAFMAAPIFLELQDLRTMAAYGPHDVPTIQVNISEPQKNAKKLADDIFNALKPGIAVIEGRALRKSLSAGAIVLGQKSDTASQARLSRAVILSQGDSAAAFGSDAVILAWNLAHELKAGRGDTVRFTWRGKYDTALASVRFIVTAVADSGARIPANALLVNDREFYRWYYMPLPAAPSETVLATLPDSSNPLHAALAPEFTLMKRAATSHEYMKAFRELSRKRVWGIVVSVQSMYETASAIIQVEFALHVITAIAGVILFFVILIGVINTLRMTIRERTREIGTVRAIGMQRSDVLSMFLLETGFLAFFASLAGAAAAFLAMWGLSSFAIDAGDNPMGMLLVNNRLFFAPTVGATVGYIAFIVAIAVVTAYFPSRRASRLSAANAMRHYE
ncbi:MAG: ABC transporter permease [Chitinispirillaceae bacterium]|nr:ABC transporter permease [Chitinispirillaceae bacterium]